MGLADIVTRRLFERIDFKATYANAFTSTFLNRAYIPVVMETDREAVAAVLDLLRMENPAKARVARITNTLKLERIQISEALMRRVRGPPRPRAGKRLGTNGLLRCGDAAVSWCQGVVEGGMPLDPAGLQSQKAFLRYRWELMRS